MSIGTVLWYYLWIAPHVLQIILLVLIFQRRFHRHLPVFSTYIAFELLQFLVLFSLSRFSPTVVTPALYGSCAMVALAISTILRFGVIYEIVSYLLRNYEILQHFGRIIFKWGTILLGLMAVALALHAHRHGSDAGTFLLFLGQRTVIFMQFGLLLVIFVFSRTLRLEWRPDIYGVALGFGIFACVELVSSALIAQFGYSLHHSMDYLTMGTYHVCVLIWMFYILRPQKSGANDLQHVPDHGVLEVWNAEMERLLNKR